MKRRAAFFIVAILIIANVCAQEIPSQKKSVFTASVVSIKGACYIRDEKSDPARRLKQGDSLCASQQVSCDRGGELKIVFEATKAERLIKKVRPDWYVIPRVPSKKPPLKTAGRSKGNDDCNKKNSN